MARGVSRRESLRRISIGLLSMAASPFLVGRSAEANANDDCAHWCNDVIGAGSARGECKSDAAHGTGLCYDCGPKAPPGSSRVLCGQRCVASCAQGRHLNTSTCGCDCPSGQRSCGGRCIPSGNCCSSDECSGGKTCINGDCVCPADRPDFCGGACVNTQSDANHCGACGRTCNDGIAATTDVCVAGACKHTCPAGQKRCDDTCIPTGHCCRDAECPNDKVCRDGACACPKGSTECGGACYAPCSKGQVFNPTACRCECRGRRCGRFKRCGEDKGCICLKTIEGGGLCARGKTRCNELERCTSTDDCPAGGVCVIRSCCGPGGVCVTAAAICAPGGADARGGPTTPSAAPSGRTLGGR